MLHAVTLQITVCCRKVSAEIPVPKISGSRAAARDREASKVHARPKRSRLREAALFGMTSYQDRYYKMLAARGDRVSRQRMAREREREKECAQHGKREARVSARGAAARKRVR